MTQPNYFRIEKEEDITKVVEFLKKNNIEYHCTFEALSLFEDAEVKYHLEENFILKDKDGNTVQPTEELKAQLECVVGDVDYIDGLAIRDALVKDLENRGLQVIFKDQANGI